LSYSLIINYLNPLSDVLILDNSSVTDYNFDELKEFNAIALLSNSVTQNDISALQRYVNDGGNIFPNILEGKNSISQEDFDKMFASETSQKELKLKQKTVNEYYIDVDGEKGWLVLSEKFAHFPGWKATLNGKDLKLYKANIVVTAIYLEGEKGKLEFKYNPQSFRTGKTITLITIIILLLYLAYNAYSRIKK